MTDDKSGWGSLSASDILANFAAITREIYAGGTMEDRPRFVPGRLAETTNSKGWREMFVKFLPDPVPPLSLDFEPRRVEFDFLRSCGGLDIGRSSRMLEVAWQPMPIAPGVEAMLADGWVWTGVQFARDGAADYPGRYAGHISGARVEAGRYADRLPTNRKRKREAAKSRRRARIEGLECTATRGGSEPS